VSANLRPRIACVVSSPKFRIEVFALALMFLLAGSAQAQVSDTCSAPATFHCVYAGNPTTATTFFFDADTAGSSSNTTTTITLGDTVRWFESLANGNFNAHTATSGTCPGGICTHAGTGPGGATTWDFPGGGNMATDTNYDLRFTAAGTYHYFCRPHGAPMQGTVVVNPGSASVSFVSISPGTSTYGQTVTFTASVTSGIVTPTGTVSFFDANTLAFYGSAGINTSTHQAVTTSATIPAGTFSIFAFYGGDSNFNSFSTGTLTLTVNPAGTSTSLAITGPNPTLAGQAASLKATVTNSSTSVTPMGNVTFTDSLGPFATIGLSGGTATWTTSTLPGGTNSITASFNDPGGNFSNSSSSAATQTVEDYQMNISNPFLTATPGQTANYNGHLVALGGFTGSVTLSCGAGAPATCTPSPTPLTPTASPGAPFTVAVQNSSNASFSFNIVGTGGGVPTRQQAVTFVVSNFALGVPNPTTVTVAPGNPSSPTSFTVYSQGGFTGVVNLRCTGGGGAALPAGVTGCNFSQNPVALDASKTISNPVTVTATASTTSAVTLGNNPIEIHGSSAAAPGAPDVVQPVTLTANAGSGTFDVGVFSFGHSNTPDPVMVGGTLEFDVTVKNFTPFCLFCIGSAATTLVVDFDNPVQIISATLPLTSNVCTVSGARVTCTGGTLFRNQSALATIKVVAPFQRTLTATFQVSSTSTDNNPANNVAHDTALIRVRPLARKGLVPKQP
jgi:plastocyanin